MLAPRKLPRRRGISLVEMAVVIAAGTVLMGVTIAALVAVQQADRRFTSRVGDRQAIGDLANQLRRDVHAAQRVAWDAAANELTMELPEGGSVAYVRVARRWERRASAAAAEEESQLAGAFRLPAGAECSVEPADAAVGQLVRIAWTTLAQPHDPWRNGPARHEVAAVVGRDLILLHEGAVP